MNVGLHILDGWVHRSSSESHIATTGSGSDFWKDFGWHKGQCWHGFNRIHLATRKDIANIEKAYGLKGVENIQWGLVPGWLKSWKLREKITLSCWLNHRASLSQRTVITVKTEFCTSSSNSTSKGYAEDLCTKWGCLCGCNTWYQWLWLFTHLCPGNWWGVSSSLVFVKQTRPVSFDSID